MVDNVIADRRRAENAAVADGLDQTQSSKMQIESGTMDRSQFITEANRSMVFSGRRAGLNPGKFRHLLPETRECGLNTKKADC